MLLSFREICEKNNLYYTLCGGTLLGAVRHKGFIPWDDDIDVLLPRPDYDRLINRFGIDLSFLPDYYKLVSWKEYTFDYPFMKLTDTRTQIENPYLGKVFQSNHIWIDIFPIDGNPEDDQELEKLFRHAIFIRQLIRLKTANPNAGKTRLKRFLKPLLVNLISRMDNQKLCKKLDDISKTYSFEDSKHIGGVLWGYGPQERIDKEAYLTPVPIQFEGEIFNAPSNYEEYLSHLYGDYMTLPSVDKRFTHEITGYIED